MFINKPGVMRFVVRIPGLVVLFNIRVDRLGFRVHKRTGLEFIWLRFGFTLLSTGLIIFLPWGGHLIFLTPLSCTFVSETVKILGPEWTVWIETNLKYFEEGCFPEFIQCLVYVAIDWNQLLSGDAICIYCAFNNL